MRQSDRKKILWFLVFLFVVVGGGAIFYAQGYRLDISPLGIKKIGAIYVKSLPASADIYLDGKLVEKSYHFFGTSFFFLQGGTLINDLFPKNYSLVLKSDGFKDWKQTLEVAPSLVTEIKYAILAPNTPDIVSTTSISGFWFAGTNIVDQVANVLKYGTRTLPGSQVLDETPDGRVLTVDRNGNIFESNLRSGGSVNAAVLMAVEGLNAANFPKTSLDANSNNLLFSNDRSVYILNLDSGIPSSAIRLPTSLTITAIASSPDFVAAAGFNAIQNYSTIFFYDKNARSTSTYTVALSGKTLQMDFKNGRLGIIQSDGSFFYGDPRSANGLVKLASDARKFSFADNADLAAVEESNSLEIIPLAGNKSDYAKFTPPNPGDIKDMSWYEDAHHLFLFYGDKTLFLDTGDAKLEHLYDVAPGGAQYMPGTTDLYFLDGFTLKKITFPS